MLKKSSLYFVERRYMTNLQKRLLLYLLGCVNVRLFFVYIARRVSLVHLQWLGYLALLPAIGFIYLYFSGARPSGPETFGEKIWWNNLRPVHALFYFLFAYYAIRMVRTAWVFLLLDVIVGLVSFLAFHSANGDFQKALKL